jgi:RNA polymerase sigma factor (sigma-70 family)
VPGPEPGRGPGAGRLPARLPRLFRLPRRRSQGLALRHRPLQPDEFEDTPAEGDTPEEALVRQGEVETVRGAIEALPEPFRETLVLRELEEMSYREIAEVTQAPIGTVMSRLARARAMLLAALGGEAATAQETKP